jgi:hypothetical protein
MKLILRLNKFLLNTTMELKWDLGKNDLLDNYDIIILQRMNKFLDCIVCKKSILLSLSIIPCHIQLAGLSSLDRNGL